MEKVSLDLRRGLKKDQIVIDNQLLQLAERLRGEFEVTQVRPQAGAEVVQDADGLAAADEVIDQVGTDEPGSAGDEREVGQGCDSVHG